MEEYDEELAALVRKNVEMLSEIQEDLCELQEAGGDDCAHVGGEPSEPSRQILTLGESD